MRKLVWLNFNLFVLPIILSVVMVIASKIFSRHFYFEKSDIIKLLFLLSVWWGAPSVLECARLLAVQNNWNNGNALDYLLRYGFFLGLFMGIPFLQEPLFVKTFAITTAGLYSLFNFTEWGKMTLQIPDFRFPDKYLSIDDTYDLDNSFARSRVNHFCYYFLPIVGYTCLVLGPFNPTPIGIAVWIWAVIMITTAWPFYAQKPCKEVGKGIFICTFLPRVLSLTSSFTALFLTIYWLS